VYSKLWDLAFVESNALSTLVRPGNRIRYDTNNRDPIKENVSDADLPELILTSGGSGPPRLHATSSGSMCTRKYSWLITTGDFRVSYRLYPVEFALFAAMSNWKAHLGALTWNSKSFAKRMDVVDVTNGLSDPDRNRGIRGWSAIWTCEIEMHFTTEDLKSW